MAVTRPIRLDPAINPARDHSLGEEDAELILVEYGSYASAACQAVHKIVANLRDRFGERMRYVFRHLPSRIARSHARPPSWRSLPRGKPATSGRCMMR